MSNKGSMFIMEPFLMTCISALPHFLFVDFKGMFFISAVNVMG